MNTTVSVPLGPRSYDIHIGAGLLTAAGTLLAPFARGVVPIVTDENVSRLHLEEVISSLRREKMDAHPIVLPPGEETKTFAGLEQLCRELIRLGIDRNALVVALGGGVIGDLVGFADGVVKRGVKLAQVPTTLLAQVDSSVGGKTAIDIPEGKNLVGAFHQPQIVVSDTRALATLPRRQLLSGYAEVVKYAALGDIEFFSWLEANASAALGGDQDGLQHIVTHSCRTKAEIVARDERETGDRALLNLGHTFGHALEAATGYSERLFHGEGVAIGMVLAFRLSERLGYSTGEDTVRVVQHLRCMGLPTEIGAIPGPRVDSHAILEHMKHDKKAEQGTLKFVLVHGLGRAFVSTDVPLEAVRAVLTD